MTDADPFETWLTAAEARYRSELSFTELRRAVQALSSVYVERRDEWRSGGPAPLGSAGKRAAFASYYAPLHFLTVRYVCRGLGAAAAASRIVDLGCGTGASGAAWALETAARVGAPASVLGYDHHPWAVEEARFTYRLLGVDGRPRRGDLTRVRLPHDGGAILLAYAVNELPDESRDRLLAALIRAARHGTRVLVVEPISRRLSPWWKTWAEAFRRAGGRADDWRFPLELPEPLLRLDRAAGLDHGVLTARSLWI